MSIQILTATTVLDTVEIERLRLHKFRAPLPEELILDASFLIENNLLTEEIVKDYLDVESVKYVNIDDVVFCFTKMKNYENFVSAVKRFNDVEEYIDGNSGLVESDLASLTIVTVYPASVINKVIQANLDLYVESVKRSFYI